MMDVSRRGRVVLTPSDEGSGQVNPRLIHWTWQPMSIVFSSLSDMKQYPNKKTRKYRSNGRFAHLFVRFVPLRLQ